MVGGTWRPFPCNKLGEKREIWGLIGGKANMRATCDDGGVKDVTHGCFFSKRWVERREFWLK